MMSKLGVIIALVSGINLLVMSGMVSYARRSDPLPRLAFISDRTGDQDVFTMFLDGSNLTNVSPQHSLDEGFWWSPNGAWLALEAYNVNVHPQVYTVRPDGSALKRVSPLGMSDSYEPRWSPNSQLLLFTTFDNRGNFKLYRTRPNGTAQSILLPDSHNVELLTWSPDGTELLFTSQKTSDAALFALNMQGQVRTLALVPQSTLAQHNLAWAGDWLYFEASRNGVNADIYRVRRDGIELTNLTQSDDFENLVGVSPDGKEVLFTVPDYDANQIFYYVITLDDSNRYLLNNEFLDVPSFSIQWNGSWVIFSVFQKSNQSSDVYSLHLPTRQLYNLSQTPESEDYPIWSADGEWVYFRSFEEVYQLIRVRPDGQEQSILAEHPFIDSLSLSQDGNWLVFTAPGEGDKSDIFVMHADGTGLRNLTQHPATDSLPQWSPVVEMPWRAGWVLLAGLGIMLLAVGRNTLHTHYAKGERGGINAAATCCDPLKGSSLMTNVK